MNLFLRLIVMVLRARFARATGVFDEHILSFSVWITDQDMFQHMNNSRYMSITDLGVIDYLLRTRLWRGLRKQRWTPVIVYKDVRLQRMLKFPQRYEVSTRLVGWRGPYACLRHEFRRGGETTARSLSIGRFIGRTERPSVEDLIRRLELQDIQDLDLPRDCIEQIDKLDAERAAAKKLERTEV